MAKTGIDPEIIKANARARSKRYYEKHRERLLEEHRVRNATPEKVKYRKDRYQANREARQEYDRQRPLDHKKLYSKLRNDPEKWAANLEYRRHRNSGISAEDEARLLVLQNNACAVCERPFTDLKIRRDHCHDTKTPRGLLCHVCNTIEGQIKRMNISPREFAANLTAYLEEPPFSRLPTEPEPPR